MRKMGDTVDKADAWDVSIKSWRMGRLAGLEEAAREAEGRAKWLAHSAAVDACNDIAAAIRALKGKT
jgi:hypothetical protein